MQQRALLCLHHVTKSLASKRLAGDRRTFQDLSSEMYSYVLALWNHLVQLLSQQVCTGLQGPLCVAVIDQLYYHFQMEMGSNDVGATLEKALLCLRVMRKLTVNGFKTPHQSNCVMEFIHSLYERMKNLLQYSEYCQLNST